MNNAAKLLLLAAAFAVAVLAAFIANIGEQDLLMTSAWDSLFQFFCPVQNDIDLRGNRTR